MSDTNTIHSANHNSQILDWDPCFKIDPISRAITTDAKKLSIMQYDHNSERFTFTMGRKVEGHDMTRCIVRIHYTNIGNSRSVSSNIYPVTDLTPCTFNEETGEYTTDENGNMVCFSWLVPGLATQYAGTLNFIVEFTCKDTDENSDSYGQVIYRWNTNVFKSIYINTSLNYDDEVAVLYSDLLEEWERKFQSYYDDMDSAVQAGKEDINTYIEAGKKDIDAYIEAGKKEVENAITAAKESVVNIAQSALDEFTIEAIADKVGVIDGKGPPSADTVAVTPTVGLIYRDTLNGELYQYTRVSGSVYCWKIFPKDASSMSSTSASNVSYDNTDSGLNSSDVQNAIDELAAFYNSGSYIKDISLIVDNGSGSGSGSGGESEIVTYEINITANNATYSGDSTIKTGGDATITFTPNNGYELSESNIKVTNADYSFNTYTGVLTLSNPTSNVTLELTAITATTIFSITVNNSNCTYSAPSTIYKNGSATITFTPNDGYAYSTSTTVIGASWNYSSGVITLYNPRSSVIVNLSCYKVGGDVVGDDSTISVRVYYGESEPDIYTDIVDGTTLTDLAYNNPDKFTVTDYEGTEIVRYIIDSETTTNKLFYVDTDDNNALVYKPVEPTMELIAVENSAETIYEFYVGHRLYLYDDATDTQYTYWYVRGHTFGQWLDTTFIDDSPAKEGTVTGSNNYVVMYAEGMYIIQYNVEGDINSGYTYITSDTSIDPDGVYHLTDAGPSE